MLLLFIVSLFGWGDGAVFASAREGYVIPGALFRVVVDPVQQGNQSAGLDPRQADAAAETVVAALTEMMAHRADYPRFDESITTNALEQVVIEPRVFNREGKEFTFLVARTDDPGKVKLLINASALQAQGYLGHLDRLVPALAREFQWVVSKADTSPKAAAVFRERDVARAPVLADSAIRRSSGDERARALQGLFGAYLRTVDDRRSLDGQPYYEIGTDKLVEPEQPDSTTKLYDIRVREALQKLVREPFFWERTPKAVRTLLNGKIWSVACVKIDQRDWATRTRVLPEDQAVIVGERGLRMQPAAILVNIHRRAAPDDPFYAETKGLPMGALSADQLARVIALEIETNIVEKSMPGHVAQDELSAPKP